jgi:hypothetical protein
MPAKGFRYFEQKAGCSDEWILYMLHPEKHKALE